MAETLGELSGAIRVRVVCAVSLLCSKTLQQEESSDVGGVADGMTSWKHHNISVIVFSVLGSRCCPDRHSCVLSVHLLHHLLDCHTCLSGEGRASVSISLYKSEN